MANNPRAAFSNDQVFLCPRPHCAAYFNLVDEYTNCDPAAPVRRGAPPGADGAADSESEEAGPSKLWYLPIFPKGSFCQWWFQRRYWATPGDTSGKLAELSWAFTTARTEWIECERLAYREQERPSKMSVAFAAVTAAAENIEDALSRCASLTRNASQFSPLPRPMVERHRYSGVAHLPLVNNVGNTCSPGFDSADEEYQASSQRRQCDVSRLKVAYALLLTQPNTPALADDSSPPWTFFDYTYTMVRRIIETSLSRTIDIVVMVTPDVDFSARELLLSIDMRVKIVNASNLEFGAPGKKTELLHRWRHTGAKLSAFNLTQYEQVLLLDTDTYMLHSSDDIFCDVLPRGRNSILGSSPLGFAAASEITNLRVPRNGRLFSSVALLRPGEAAYAYLAQSFLKRVASFRPGDNLFSDQDILIDAFLYNMTCLPERYNCRVHHSAVGLCFGLHREGDVWQAVDILHAKLGSCAVARIFPRAHGLWLRGLPPGRRPAIAAVADSGLPPGIPCPSSPGALPGLYGGVKASASRSTGSNSFLATMLKAVALVLLILLALNALVAWRVTSYVSSINSNPSGSFMSIELSKTRVLTDC
jgi:hypothetical protein